MKPTQQDHSPDMVTTLFIWMRRCILAKMSYCYIFSGDIYFINITTHQYVFLKIIPCHGFIFDKIIKVLVALDKET